MFITNNIIAINKVNNIKDSNKLIKKCGKLLKTGKLFKSLKLSKLENSRDDKLSKFLKSTKLEKKLLKNENLSNFYTKKNRSSFLAFNAKIAFQCL